MKSQQPNSTSFIGSRTFKPAASGLGSASQTLRKSKMEGFDVSGGIATASGSAAQTVRNGSIARNRSKQPEEKKSTLTLEQNINEQYIKGLQDETKLLEYELKLLKDKETEEQANFTSFFKYFNDGVPINDNIIAMKSVYSTTQRNLSETLTKHNEELTEVQESNAQLEQDISECDDRTKEIKDIVIKKKDTFSKEYNKYERLFFDEMYYAKENEPEVKDLQKKTRFFQGEIMVFNRNRDKEQMIAGRKEALDAQALDKIKKNVKNIEEMILEKSKEVDDRLSADAFEHDKAFLEEQIEVMKKRILSVKTDLSMVTVKIAEQKYILENQAKERDNEVSQRLGLNNKLLDIKELIEDQIDPLQQRIDQLGKENPKRDSKVQDLEQQIARAEQQLDLINQFNNFNFEEAKMAYASNNQINKSIEKLVREYKKITSN